MLEPNARTQWLVAESWSVGPRLDEPSHQPVSTVFPRRPPASGSRQVVFVSWANNLWRSRRLKSNRLPKGPSFSTFFMRTAGLHDCTAHSARRETAIRLGGLTRNPRGHSQAVNLQSGRVPSSLLTIRCDLQVARTESQPPHKTLEFKFSAAITG